MEKGKVIGAWRQLQRNRSAATGTGDAIEEVVIHAMATWIAGHQLSIHIEVAVIVRAADEGDRVDGHTIGIQRVGGGDDDLSGRHTRPVVTASSERGSGRILVGSIDDIVIRIYRGCIDAGDVGRGVSGGGLRSRFPPL